MDKVEVRIFKDGRRGGAHLDGIVGESGWYYSTNGKPVLLGEGFVNWSYSDEWMVFARGNVELGVDVEKFFGLPYDVSDYSFVLAEDEARRVTNSDDFIQLWTRKESFVKMLGIGLSDRLDVLDTYAIEKARDVFFNTIRSGDRSITVCTRVPVVLDWWE